jgi:hypothetical protein
MGGLREKGGKILVFSLFFKNTKAKREFSPYIW